MTGQPIDNGGSFDTAIDELYRCHGDWLRELVGQRLRVQRADADDIVQDTYLRAARQRTGSIERPRAFLSQIALNLFRDDVRRQKVRSEHSRLAQCASSHVVRGSDMSEQEAVLQLERLVVEMPEHYRDVFVLSRFRHMTNRDIAAHLGVSIKTVEWRMSKALEFCLSRLRD